MAEMVITTLLCTQLPSKCGIKDTYTLGYLDINNILLVVEFNLNPFQTMKGQQYAIK